MEPLSYRIILLNVNRFSHNSSTGAFSEKLHKKRKLPPPLKSVAALPCEIPVINYMPLQQLFNQKMEQNRLLKGDNDQKCQVLDHMCMQINCSMCPNCLPSTCMYGVVHARYRLMDASVMHCSVQCQHV